MATESYKSNRVGDAKYKPTVIGMPAGDKTQPIMNGGMGNKGTKGGMTTEQDLRLGTRLCLYTHFRSEI